MRSIQTLRRSFANRLMMLLALGAIPSACGGTVTSIDEDDDSGEGGSGGEDGEGGDGQGGAAVGGGNQGGAGGSQDVKSCIAFDGTDCPHAVDAPPLLPGNACGMPPWVVSGPTIENGQCCYMVVQEPSESCGAGRPYFVDERIAFAPVVRSDGWLGRGATPDSIEALPSSLGSALAEAWTRDALLEHASVASFSRFALDLMAAGAPAQLVEAAHVAAIDEVRHARACFDLASAYAGAEIGPGAFPFGGSIPLDGDLAHLAAAAVREGCIGETLAALQAAEQASHASDPAVRAALEQIAADEARHAELAWQAVAWALSSGREDVRAAVAAAFDVAGASLPPDVAADDEQTLLAHGRLAGRRLHASMRRALDEVVRPCAAALLAGHRRHDDELKHRSRAESHRARREAEPRLSGDDPALFV